MSLDLGELVARAKIDLSPVRGQLRDLDVIVEDAAKGAGAKAGKAGGKALAAGLGDGAAKAGKDVGAAVGDGLLAGVKAKAASITAAISGALGDGGKELAAGFAGGIIGGGVLDSVGGLADKLMGAVDAASDLNETVNKSQAIFGAQASAVEKWSEGSAENFGLSKAAALDYAASLGDMFTQIGSSGSQAAKMSEKVVQLAADLGSFNNLDTGDVLERITAAFRGEYDSLQAIVPNINAARVQTEALSETGKKNANQLTAQEKATATLNVILKDTSKAQGDFARTHDQAANRAKSNAAEVANLQAKVGQGLLPAYKAFLQLIGNVGLPALGHLVDAGGAVVNGIKPLIGLFQGLPGPVKAVAAALAGLYLANRLFGSRLSTIGGQMRSFGGNVRAMGQLAREEAPHVGRFNAVVGAIGTGNGNISRMAQSFERAAGQASRFPRAAGSAAAAMTGMRSAAGGLVDVLGGPWGLALAGAGVALMFWQKHQQAAAQAALEHKQRVQELTQAIIDDGNKVGAKTKQNIVDKLVDDGVINQAKKYGLSLDTVTHAALGNKDAIDDVNKALMEHGSTVQIDAGKLQGGAKQTRVLTDEARKAQKAILGETQSTKEGIAAAKQKAEAEKSSGREYKKTAAAAKEVPAAVKEYVAAQKDAQDAAKETARANKQLRTDLDDANSAFFATRDASRSYQQALADARAAAKEQGKAGTGDNSQKGRDNAEKLDTAAKDALANIKQLYDTHASNSKLTKTLTDSRRDLTLLAESFGMTKKEAQKYVKDALADIPSDIHTTVTADTRQAKADLKSARAAAKALGTSYDKLPKSVQTELKTLGEVKARRIAQALGIDYDSLSRDVQTQLIADSSNAKAAVKDVGKSYDDLPKNVQTKITTIGGTTAKSTIQGVLDKAHDKLMTVTAKARLGHVLDELGAVDRAAKDKTFSVTAVYKEIHPGDNLARHLRGYASGTMGATEGLHPLAENGAELVLGPRVRWLPAGAKVLTHQQTMAVLGAAAKIASPTVPVAGTGMATAAAAPVPAGQITHQTTHSTPINIEKMYGADIPAIKAETARQKFLAAAGTRKAGM